jgi:exopolysaccharide production protein ExoQ
MPPYLASAVYAGLVATLFFLIRDRQAKTSPALWIPLIWVWLASSRAVAEWLAVIGLGPPVVTEDAYVSGSPGDRFVLTALMVAALVVLGRRGRLIAGLRSNPFVVMFFVYAALSSLWSDFGDITIRRWFKATGDVLMAMVVITDANPGAALRRLLVSAGFLLIPHSVLLIKYYPAIGRTYNRWTWVPSFTGVTTHKNYLGVICQVYGVAFFSCFLNVWRDPARASRRRELFAYAMAFVMVLWLFWYANSVTSQSCFVLACLFLLIASGESMRRSPWLTHAIVAVLVLVPSMVLLLGVGAEALQGLGRDATLTGRTDIWSRVLALSGNPLLGTGFESFWLGRRLQTMQDWYSGLNSSHNGFLEIFVTLGWIGVALLTGLIVTGYRQAMDTYQQDAELGALKIAYLIAVVVSSITEAAFRTPGLTWIVFLLTSMRSPSDLAVRAHIGGRKVRAPRDRTVRDTVVPAVTSVRRELRHPRPGLRGRLRSDMDKATQAGSDGASRWRRHPGGDDC